MKVLIVLAAALNVCGAAGDEILKDPSFESGDAPFSRRTMEQGWTPTKDADDPRYVSRADATHVLSGKGAWMLGCENPTGRTVITFRSLPVRPSTRYVFRAHYYFGEDAAHPLLVWGNVLQQDASGKGHCAYFNCPHYDTHVGRWNELEIPFYAATNAATANVELIFGGRAKVWLDDFSFVEEPEPAPAAPVGGVLSDGDALSVGWLAPFSKAVPKGFPAGLGKSPDGKVRLDAAKNEKESFQLVLVAKRALKDVTVRLVGLGFPVKVREVKFVPIANAKNPAMNRLHPDPLPPFAKGDVAAGENLTLYLTVTVPATAAAGVAGGAVEILSGGTVVARVPLEVRVRNFALPERAALKSYFYANVGYAGKAYQTFDPRPAKTIEDEIHRLYHEIRLTGNQAWERPTVKWTLKDGHVVVTDWSAYDAAVERLHREFGFTSVPYPMVGMLGDNSGWFGGREPKKMRSGRTMGTKPRKTPFGGYFDDETGLSRVVDFARQFVAHAKERFPSISFYWYIYDEVPMEVAPQLVPIVKRLEDDVPGINLFMVSTPNAATLPHYQVRTAPFDASNLDDAHPNYDESWYYQYPTTIVDGGYLRNRLFPWEVYAAKGTGVLLWNVIYYGTAGGRKRGVYNPWTDLTALYDTAQPTILYPPRPGTDEGVVPSIRSLLVGDAIDDFDYLKLLEAKVGREATMRFVAKLVPKPLEWERDPQRLLEVRQAIAEELER